MPNNKFTIPPPIHKELKKEEVRWWAKESRGDIGSPTSTIRKIRIKSIIFPKVVSPGKRIIVNLI